MSTLYGLRTYKEDGTLAVEVTDKMLRVIHSQALAAGSSGSLALPGFNESNASAYVMTHQSDRRPPWAVMGNGAVTWGVESWWPVADRASGTLFVVAKR
ncbi:hypothetical protein [Pseudomonas sp. R32]|uniref:hypothetical protein n=1 Tax=Pseudomonas sp. R32 TaxID=1573704 RepID=UPI001331A00B|nr:hypothetical protein [Pseudomonas sp. R32]